MINTTHIIFILNPARKISKTVLLTTWAWAFLPHVSPASTSLVLRVHVRERVLSGIPCLSKKCQDSATMVGQTRPRQEALQACSSCTELSKFVKALRSTVGGPLHKCRYLRNSRSPRLWGSPCGGGVMCLCRQRCAPVGIGVGLVCVHLCDMYAQQGVQLSVHFVVCVQVQTKVKDRCVCVHLCLLLTFSFPRLDSTNKPFLPTLTMSIPPYSTPGRPSVSNSAHFLLGNRQREQAGRRTAQQHPRPGPKPHVQPPCLVYSVFPLPANGTASGQRGPDMFLSKTVYQSLSKNK